MSHDLSCENGLMAFKTVEKVLVETGWEPERTDIEGLLRVDFSTESAVDTARFLAQINEA